MQDEYFTVGPRNLLTDVQGLKVGHASDNQLKTGTTVLTSDQPFIASVDVMGGAPGTRETDCLAPDKLVDQVDALVLSGGSAFGLEAASGVVNALSRAGRGFQVGPVRVPIVPAAILFDLLNGGRAVSGDAADANADANADADATATAVADASDNDRASHSSAVITGQLYRELGEMAFATASEDFALGTVGAGTGATTANLKGGLGSASLCLPGGGTVAALVAANPHGSAVIPGKPNFWAAAMEIGDEFGGLGSATMETPLLAPRNEKLQALEKYMATVNSQAPGPLNTTLAIVATDIALNKAQLKRLAIAAQDGMARALMPAHTPFDGDLVFSVSTAAYPLRDPVSDTMMLGHAASLCVSRAIARAVYLATPGAADTLPCWQTLHA